MKGWVGLVGWPTADSLHISGHSSAAGRAHDSKSSPVKDRRSTIVSHNQLTAISREIEAFLHAEG